MRTSENERQTSLWPQGSGGIKKYLVGLPKKIKNKIQKEKRRMASVRQRAIRNSWNAASIFAPLPPEGPVKVRRVPSEPDSRPHFISRRDVFISRTLLSSFTPSAAATQRHAVGRRGDSFDVAVQMCRLVFVYLFCERWPAAGEGRGVSSSCSLEEAGSRCWRRRFEKEKKKQDYWFYCCLFSVSFIYSLMIH